MRPGTHGRLSVWRADLDAIGPLLDDLDARHRILSADERGWPRLVRPEVAQRRCRTRIALRLLLRRTDAALPFATPIPTTQFGKPMLANGGATFNVSHTQDIAVIAVGSASGAIGVDAETIRPIQLSSARRALIVAAAAAMIDHPNDPLACQASDSNGAKADIAAWTVLEAFGKARGTGVGQLLTELGITATGARSIQPSEAAERASQIVAGSGLAVAHLPMPDAFRAAVAAPPDALPLPAAVTVLNHETCLRLAQAATQN